MAERQYYGGSEEEAGVLKFVKNKVLVIVVLSFKWIQTFMYFYKNPSLKPFYNFIVDLVLHYSQSWFKTTLN